MNVNEIIESLDMKRRPEGGWVRQTYVGNDKSKGSSIYLLLVKGEPTPWKTTGDAQILHHYLGDPLQLKMAKTEDGQPDLVRLGKDLLAGEKPQGIIPNGWWRSAETLGAFTLVGCTKSPGYDRNRFDLADPTLDLLK